MQLAKALVRVIMTTVINRSNNNKNKTKRIFNFREITKEKYSENGTENTVSSLSFF